jgi:GT2 family glycosyltransferase
MNLEFIDFNRAEQFSLAQPFVSIIVLNYNGEKYLHNLFVSLEKTNYPKGRFEVIMGDNGSSDNSVKYTIENFPFVKILQFDNNYGFCKGNNLCVKEAIGQYIVFLNTDIIVTKNWLKNLVDSILGERNAVCAGSKLLKPYSIDGKRVIDYAGGKLTYEINFYEGQFEYDDQKYSIQKNTGFGCGAAVLVKKQFFEDIGGFDEYYFGGGEEVELGLRAWQYGFKVLFVPSSIIYHLRSGTFKPTDPFPTYAWVKSMFYFIFKNYEKKNSVLYLFESLVFTHFPKLLVFVLNNNLSMSKSVMKGMLDFLLELKNKGILSRLYQKRHEIEKNRKITDNELTKFEVTSSFSERMRYRIKSYQRWKAGKY